MSEPNRGMARSTDALGIQGMLQEFGSKVSRCMRYLGVLEPDLERVSQLVIAQMSSSLAASGSSSLTVAVYRGAVRIWCGYEPHSGFAYADARGAKLHQARAELLELLSLLSPQQRIVIVLYEIEQLSIDEVAEVMDNQRDAVLAILHEARAELLRARTEQRRSTAGDCDSMSPHVARKVG